MRNKKERMKIIFSKVRRLNSSLGRNFAKAHDINKTRKKRITEIKEKRPERIKKTSKNNKETKRMVEYAQFVEEFYLNLDNQGFELSVSCIKIIHGIWLDYLYVVCPSYAICVDPKIIDSSRKQGFLLKNENVR